MRTVAAVLIFLISVLPLEAATYKIRWRLGHKNLDFFEEAAAKFKQVVETGSDGDIQVEIFAQSSDEQGPGLDGPEIAAQVARGEVEMGHSFTDVMGGLEPRLHVFEAPYLFRGYRHMEGVFQGPIGAELLEGLREHGLVGLSFTYSGGATGVATGGRGVRRPEDLKGLKVGVYGDAVNTAWLEQLGAKAVPIGHRLSRILPMAEQGSLDAVVTTWRNFDRERLGLGFSNVGLMGSTYLVSVTYANAKFFDALPEQYRSLIAQASREAGLVERARTIQLNESAKRGMTEDKGIRAIHQSKADRDAFVQAVQPAYERSIDRILGKDLLERIRSTPDAPEDAPGLVRLAKH